MKTNRIMRYGGAWLSGLLIWAAVLILLLAGCASPSVCTTKQADQEEPLPLLPALPALPAVAEVPAGYFEDPVLEKAIRTSCGKETGALTQEDLDGIHRLVISGAGLKSLSGLEHCRFLRELHLPDNDLTDPAPIQKLTELNHLNLAGNRGVDIVPLQTLIGLEELNLSGCEIDDLAALQPLVNLKILDLTDNQIENVVPLQNMIRMSMLLLADNPIQPEALWVLRGMRAEAIMLELPEP